MVRYFKPLVYKGGLALQHFQIKIPVKLAIALFLSPQPAGHYSKNKLVIERQLLLGQ